MEINEKFITLCGCSKDKVIGLYMCLQLSISKKLASVCIKPAIPINIIMHFLLVMPYPPQAVSCSLLMDIISMSAYRSIINKHPLLMVNYSLKVLLCTRMAFPHTTREPEIN